MLSGDVIEDKYPDLYNSTTEETLAYETQKANFASSFACFIGVLQILLGVLQFHSFCC